MAPYHRTQIQLHRRQYELLKRRAAQQNVSLSALLRWMVDERFQDGGGHRLADMCGIATAGPFSGSDEDRVIYSDDEA